MEWMMEMIFTCAHGQGPLLVQLMYASALPTFSHMLAKWDHLIGICTLKGLAHSYLLFFFSVCIISVKSFYSSSHIVSMLAHQIDFYLFYYYLTYKSTRFPISLITGRLYPNALWNSFGYLGAVSGMFK